MSRFEKYIYALLLLGLLIGTRLPKLNSYVALDEPAWLTRGGNFYYALGQREFQNTVYEYHPSVTNMWFVTGAFLVYFPEYRGLGQGYFEVDKNKFDPFLLEYGKSSIELLHISRMFQVAVISLFALLAFSFLSYLVGRKKAFLALAFATSGPYFLGHSRVLSHEAMVAIFVLASILSMMVYLEYERKWYYLFLSAGSAALAQLTKSSAMAMFPVIVLILAIFAFERGKLHGYKPAILESLKIFLIWFMGMVIVYFVIWPGMWVAPGKMLYEVYGNAFSYAFQGARLQVAQELQPSHFTLGDAVTTIRSYLNNYFWRSTPIGLVGAVIAFLFLFVRMENPFSAVFKKLSLYLFTLAVMFILLFSFAEGRNSPHYIMTSYLCMDVFSALGWGLLIEKLWLRQKVDRIYLIHTAAIAALIILQLASAVRFYPYFYTYYNPVLAMVTGKQPVSDYGEGFEQAAAFLADKPNSTALNVLAFRARGPFSFFFPGKTIVLDPLFVEDSGMPSMLERLEMADYLVINSAFSPRTNRTKLFVQGLSGVIPEYSYQAKGASTIYVYRIADLPPSFYETLSK